MAHLQCKCTLLEVSITNQKESKKPDMVLFRSPHPRGGLGKTHFSRLFEPYPKGPVSPLIMAQSAPNDGYMVSMKEGIFRAPPIRR